MTYTVQELTQDLVDGPYCNLISKLLEDHGEAEITEDEYGCVKQIRAGEFVLR